MAEAVDLLALAALVDGLGLGLLLVFFFLFLLLVGVLLLGRILLFFLRGTEARARDASSLV